MLLFIRFLQHPEAILLDARVVVAVHVVKADNLPTTILEQLLTQERVDEASIAESSGNTLLAHELHRRLTSPFTCFTPECVVTIPERALNKFTPSLERRKCASVAQVTVIALDKSTTTRKESAPLTVIEHTCAIPK